jgi:hypothetical protein
MDEVGRLPEPEEEEVAGLPPQVAGPLGRSLGTDVTAVRVHTGERPAAEADRLGARAYTRGQDVHLGRGEQPTDLGLIAHEVAHTVQQRSAGPRVPLFDAGGGEAALEHEARAAADAVVRGTPAIVTGRTDGPRTQRQPRGAATTARAANAQIIAERAFNMVMNQWFPGPTRGWYSGCRISPTVATVEADIATGRDGYAMFSVGVGFAADVLPATLAARVPDVRRELARVLAWRLGLGILTAADLGIPLVNETLRAMRPADLRALRTRDRVEQPARDEIDRILGITTVIPAAAQIGGDGSASVTVGGISVRLLPDRRAGTQNDTSFRLVPDAVQTPAVSLDRRGRVSSINGPMPTIPSVEIQTTYAQSGRAASADPITAVSGYGRGKTPEDRAAGNTSLRFHESRHGADFLAFIAANPYRPFAGRVGMTRREWNAEVRAFLAAHRAWARNMGQFSLCATDCVGDVTIDDFHSGERGYRLQCTGCNH